jgi:uncharacterized protein (TIGR03000 family)
LAAARVQPFRSGLANRGAFQDRRGFGGYGYGYGNRFWGGNYFNPLLGFWGWGWPGYSPYYNGYYDAYYPPFDYGGGYMPIADIYGGYGPPADTSGGAAISDAVPIPAAGAAPAQIDVIVPDADATVWFNGFQTTSRGINRQFDTPDLQPGVNYSYTVKAAWTQNGTAMSREYVVRVNPGARVLVDFTQSPRDMPIAK